MKILRWVLVLLIALQPLRGLATDITTQDLTHTMRIDTEFMPFLEQWAEEVAATYHAKYPSKQHEEIDNIFQEENQKARQQILIVAQQILERFYSPDDMARLDEFYRTSIGQKLLVPWIGNTVEPSLTDEEKQKLSDFRETALGKKEARARKCLEAQLLATGMGVTLMTTLRSEARLNSDTSKDAVTARAEANFPGEDFCRV